jgi:GT2 family glycosyltransferase
VYYGHLYRELILRDCICTITVMVRQKVLHEVGMFDETLKIGEDYDLWLRIARNHPVVYIDRVFCIYRLRDDGLSGGQEVRSLRWLEAHTAVREKHLRSNWIPGQHRDLLNDVLSGNYWGLGWNCFTEEQFKEARTYFLKGVRYRPLHFRNWLYWCSCFLPLRVIETVRSIKRAVKVGKFAP